MNIPALSAPYTLSPGQIREYEANGHIFLKGLAEAREIAFYREAISEAVKKLNTERRKMEDRDTYGKAFLQICNLWRQNEVLKTFVMSRRFAGVAAQLMGVERVRIYHDQALFKEPGGGRTPWHQDQYYWPLDTDKTITMWMPVVDITKEMGIMNFVSKTHRLGYLAAKKISDESEDYFNSFIRENNYSIAGAPGANAGDASFHAGWTLHNAPANQSEKMREVMTVIYFADKTRVLKPDNENRQADLEKWLMNVPPGQYANSELNPLV